MNLPQLSKPQWDAALAAAKALMSADPNDAADRATFRNAKSRLAETLPGDADMNGIIRAAVRWDMMNGLAASLAMIPGAAIERAPIFHTEGQS